MVAVGERGRVYFISGLWFITKFDTGLDVEFSHFTKSIQGHWSGFDM